MKRCRFCGHVIRYDKAKICEKCKANLTWDVWFDYNILRHPLVIFCVVGLICSLTVSHYQTKQQENIEKTKLAILKKEALLKERKDTLVEYTRLQNKLYASTWAVFFARINNDREEVNQHQNTVKDVGASFIALTAKTKYLFKNSQIAQYLNTQFEINRKVYRLIIDIDFSRNINRREIEAKINEIYNEQKNQNRNFYDLGDQILDLMSQELWRDS